MTGLERHSISFRELAHLAAKCALGADRKIRDVLWEIYEEKWLIPDEEQHLRGGNHPGTLRSLEGIRPATHSRACAIASRRTHRGLRHPRVLAPFCRARA